MANQYYNGTVSFQLGDKEYEATVSATATYTFIKGRKYMANGDPGYPDEEDFEINDVDVHSIVDLETGEEVEELDEMIDAIWDALDDVDWEYDDPEPDYDDYWEERAMARWEAECDRMGY